MVHENRNLAGRLIGLVETHADQLTLTTVAKLRTNARTPSYGNLSPDELYARVYDVYHDFGRWLFEKAESAVQERYNKVGELRAKQGVPLPELLWAMVLTKNHLRSYLAAWAPADSAVELYRQREFEQLIAQFFDRAMCYAAEGYERVRDETNRTSGAESTDFEFPQGEHRRGPGGWIL